MLELFDLSKKISRDEYKAMMTDMEARLGRLQRESKELNIPIIILFEGWEAAGKGTLVNRLALSLDARGFNVYPIHPPNVEEELRPPLWRFWTKIPDRGRIAIFDKSWCGRILEDRVEKKVSKKTWIKAYDEINSFERQLTNDGYLIVKFFLHISPKMQIKRFKKLEGNPATKWRVTKSDLRQHKKYPEYLGAYEDMLAKTSTDVAPWTIVEAHDRRFATLKIFKTLIETAERRIIDERERRENKSERAKVTIQLPELPESILDRVDLSLSLTREKYASSLGKKQDRIRELEHEVYIRRIPVIIVYEGWDASGKGGNIRRLVQKMDPRGYEVVPIGIPNEVELKHHYLWRFWTKIPKAGHIVIFDRSWYGRVMVERIEGFCTEAEWMRAYSEINEMEEQLTNFGTVLIKFWIHVSAEEQLRRFQDRKDSPYKQWKITDEDWRNRDKWERYKDAVDEMLLRTSTSYAPWTIIEGNSKLYARIKALESVIQAVEAKLKP